MRRESVPASELVVAMECGGSDAYSGIAANPVVGRASDRIVWQGGTAAFAETPEVYGAEHLLAARARDPLVAQRLLDRIAWWQDYATHGKGSMDSNPAPGNKAGGITTILEKSLGAITKGGTTDLVEVVEYAEPMHGPGLVFMDSPGYDPVSVTGLVAGGAQVVCFTTGRGSVFGCSPVPSIKVASNTPMYERMRDDMDVNAGRVVDGQRHRRRGRRRALRAHPRGRLRPPDAERDARHRPGRVRALAGRRGDVRPCVSTNGTPLRSVSPYRVPSSDGCGEDNPSLAHAVSSGTRLSDVKHRTCPYSGL